MRNKWKPVDFDRLCEDQVFSREEYDLLLENLRYELEYASTNVVRAWEKQPVRTRDALGRLL